jgi:hypothetical protein
MVAFILALIACSPALNWRDVRPEGTRLSMLLPCKPDKAEKQVPLGGRPTALRMLGCDADGLTFAISAADLGDASQAPAVLLAWQQVTLTNMKAAKADTIKPLKLIGATGGQAVWVQATGLRTDGTPVLGHAAYFAHGATVFQAVIYGADIKTDVAQTYFSGMKFE